MKRTKVRREKNQKTVWMGKGSRESDRNIPREAGSSNLGKSSRAGAMGNGKAV